MFFIRSPNESSIFGQAIGPFFMLNFARLCFAAVLFSGSFAAVAQIDTLRVVSYNLTNYGNNVTGCTAANNGLTIKNPEFKTIMKHLMPDILGVCEMNTNPAIATSFLNNVLNTDGISYYKRSNIQPETAGSTITSMLFFNQQKLTLHSQSFAPTLYRLAHHFRLYCNTAGLATGDTIWLNIIACHLKAGNTTPDAADRATMAATIRTYLNSFPRKENFMIMGDFNTYRASEVAFVNLTAPTPSTTYQFLDPINRVGAWNTNASFADVHTQCPTSSSNGCFSGGGLDDRFDFILMNRHLLYDSAKARYIPGSYKAVGNDGNHYNKSITDSPTNNSAPSSVLASLTKASDHLPVMARLAINGVFTSASNSILALSLAIWQTEDQQLMLTGFGNSESVQGRIINLEGRMVTRFEGWARDGSIEVPITDLKAGLYVIQGLAGNGRPFYSKVLISK